MGGWGSYGNELGTDFVPVLNAIVAKGRPDAGEQWANGARRRGRGRRPASFSSSSPCKDLEWPQRATNQRRKKGRKRERERERETTRPCVAWQFRNFRHSSPSIRRHCYFNSFFLISPRTGRNFSMLTMRCRVFFSGFSIHFVFVFD